jgi:amidophosphoribosyltransferase
MGVSFRDPSSETGHLGQQPVNEGVAGAATTLGRAFPPPPRGALRVPSAHGQSALPPATDPSDDAYQPEDPVGEECGVFGVWAPGEDVAKLTYYGLYALQHRGQEAAGMAVSDGSNVLVYKELGLVAQVFDEATLSSMVGHLAIGHTRYSTTGSGTWENAQPSFRTLETGGSLALGHNGNLTNTDELARRVAELDPKAGSMGATTDSDLITTLLASRADVPLDVTAREVLPTLQGAFCLTFMDEHTLYAARDPHGVRPLVLGRLDRGWVVASETAALDIVGATLVREVEPGELLAIDEDGVRSERFAPATPKGCLFEYVYLARPDTTIAGRSVNTARVQTGRTLAFEAPADADLVIPVPESGTPAAIGFAEQSGIRTARGSSRTPTSAAPSSSRRRRSASSASGSSSTRCARSSPASAWSSSTTRSCAATPSARWCACSARPARPRSTCASPARPSCGRASTASTSPAGPSSSPAASASRRSGPASAPTASPSSRSTG